MRKFHTGLIPEDCDLQKHPRPYFVDYLHSVPRGHAGTAEGAVNILRAMMPANRTTRLVDSLKDARSFIVLKKWDMRRKPFLQITMDALWKAYEAEHGVPTVDEDNEDSGRRLVSSQPRMTMDEFIDGGFSEFG